MEKKNTEKKENMEDHGEDHPSDRLTMKEAKS